MGPLFLQGLKNWAVVDLVQEMEEAMSLQVLACRGGGGIPGEDSGEGGDSSSMEVVQEEMVGVRNVGRKEEEEEVLSIIPFATMLECNGNAPPCVRRE